MFHTHSKYHAPGDLLDSSIRWAVFGVIQSAPTDQHLWLAMNRLDELRFAYRKHHEIKSGKGYQWYPPHDTCEERIVDALLWASAAIRSALDNRPQWPSIQASVNTLRALETAKRERPASLTRCLDQLERLGRGKGYQLSVDHDGFNFAAGGLHGGLIWHATPGEWSIHT